MMIRYVMLRGGEMGMEWVWVTRCGESGGEVEITDGFATICCRQSLVRQVLQHWDSN